MTKPTKWPVRPAKTQINLGIRPVWSVSSLSAWRNIGPLTTYWVYSDDSDQTGQMPRLMSLPGAHLSYCWFCFLVPHCLFLSILHNNFCMLIRFHMKILSPYDWAKSCLCSRNTSGIFASHWICRANLQMSPVKQICVFEHSVMKNFNCACPAIQRGLGSGFLSEGSSWLTACMSEQGRFWQDCADAQARLNLRCSHRQ